MPDMRNYGFVEQKAFESFYNVKGMAHNVFVNPQITRVESESFYSEADSNPINVINPLEFR